MEIREDRMVEGYKLLEYGIVYRQIVLYRISPVLTITTE